MGKLKTFEIFVDNQDGQVAAGETLRGEVVLETTEDIDVIGKLFWFSFGFGWEREDHPSDLSPQNL